jgi:hypothetical protein
MDFRLKSARVVLLLVLVDSKSIIISSKYGEFCDFLNSDFGWTPNVVDLAGVHPKNVYIVLLSIVSLGVFPSDPPCVIYQPITLN